MSQEELAEDAVKTIHQYQRNVMETAVYPQVGNNPTYAVNGLVGEVGEFMNLVKKVQRDSSPEPQIDPLLPWRVRLIDELGDAFWYVVALMYEMGMAIQDERLDVIGSKLQQQHPTCLVLGGGRVVDFPGDAPIWRNYNELRHLGLAISSSSGMVAHDFFMAGSLGADDDKEQAGEIFRTRVRDSLVTLVFLIGLAAKILGSDMDALANANVRKLRIRQTAGTLHGDARNE